MAREIERKFLVRDDSWQQLAGPGMELRQGYLASSEHCSIRVRQEPNAAHLNIKGATLGISRIEYEYPIPLEDAEELLERLCGDNIIHKTRYLISVGPHTWEIDEFHGANEGLVVAEIELRSEQESFEHPPWLGEEVSYDPRYYNVRLAARPYRDW